jgi:hypothetical protein
MKVFDKKYSYPTEKFSEMEQEHLNSSIYKWFYKNHYFMIKILQNFFNKLYILWGIMSWDMEKDIKTEYNEKKPLASQMFFLFTTFYELLMEYRKKYNKKIANYIRINKLPLKPGQSDPPITFEKLTENKNFLNVKALAECKANLHSKEISEIKFEEIFDPDNFQNNGSIPMYMGLSNFIKSQESIVTVTYGYSGVGKTFTLFGGKQKDEKGNDKKNEKGNPIYVSGMLQTTLTDIGTNGDISVKIFELYGLGVPYGFYWESTKTLCHSIYHYGINSDGEISVKIITKNNDGKFPEFLDKNDLKNYTKLSLQHIENFSEYIEKIDDLRKKGGRIKKTVNNPESSRSIMIYDFLIQIKEVNVHFVIIDLPGKENIYETYCVDNKFTNIKDEFLNFNRKQTISSISVNNIEQTLIDSIDDIEPIASDKKDTPDRINDVKNSDDAYVEAIKNEKYSEILLKLIIFVNPLWASMIPELATNFDLKNQDKLFSADVPTYGDLTLYNSRAASKNDNKMWFKKDIVSKPPSDVERGKSYTANKLFSPKPYDKYKEDVNKFNQFKFGMLRLRGLYERALYNIVEFIKSGELNKLGDLLNKMLVSYLNPNNEKELMVNYGYAGLEAFYINENILGLLQVLANKVTGEPKRVDVVCDQQQYYSQIFRDGNYSLYNYPLHTSITKDEPLYHDKNIGDDEFFSQLHFINEFEKQNFTDRVMGKEDEDLFKNKFRILTDTHFTDNTDKKYMPKHFNKPYTDMLKNYDYNRAFNKKTPPIESILEPYIKDIQNIFLFFVVTNHPNKQDKSTCDKQMKLLYDTRTFMDVVAGIDSKLQCNL